VSSQGEIMNQREGKRPLTKSSGFTLVELVLATLISALVIGIFSVALSISLRTWERQQNREASDLPSLLQLLRLQLAEFDPVLINVEGKQRSIFQGDAQSLAFATDYSVRAISKGIPVVARYLFVPERGELYYGELPLDPYHPELIQKFLQMSPGDPKSWPHFYLTEVAGFALSYVGEEQEASAPSFDAEAIVPKAVTVECTSRGDLAPFSTAMFVNSPFTRQAPGQLGGRGIQKSPRLFQRKSAFLKAVTRETLSGDGKAPINP
jgi:hypothetical protein